MVYGRKHFDEIVELLLKDKQTSEDLGAPGEFCSRLGLSEREEKSSTNWSRLVDDEKVDEVLLELSKSREFMRPVRTRKTLAPGDRCLQTAEGRLRRDGPNAVARLWSHEAGLVPKTERSEQLADRLRSLKACELIHQVDELRMGKLHNLAVNHEEKFRFF